MRRELCQAVWRAFTFTYDMVEEKEENQHVVKGAIAAFCCRLAGVGRKERACLELAFQPAETRAMDFSTAGHACIYDSSRRSGMNARGRVVARDSLDEQTQLVKHLPHYHDGISESPA